MDEEPIDGDSGVVLASAMEQTGELLLRSMNNSFASMDNQGLVNSYRSTIRADRAVWLIRTRIANEIYSRIKSTLGLTPESKADKEIGKAIAEVCTSLGVTYATFMYDVRMYERLFDPAFDDMENISAASMVAATEVITQRTHFAEATNSTQPRRVIQEAVNIALSGQPVTAKVIREIIKRLKGSAEDKLPEVQSSKEKLIDLISGTFPEPQEEFICGVFNAMNYIKTNPDDTVYLYYIDGELLAQGRPPQPKLSAPIIPALAITPDGVSIMVFTMNGHKIVAVPSGFAIQEREP